MHPSDRRSHSLAPRYTDRLAEAGIKPSVGSFGDWFNNRRLLEAIGNVPPAEAKARYYARADVQALAA